MTRLTLESLETRETPSAGVVGHTDPVSVAADPSGNTYYVGSANGGVWKTTNGGGTFYGTGVYKSVDAGRTW